MRKFVQKLNQNQKRNLIKSARTRKVTLKPSMDAHPILQLQRTIGNQAVLRLLRSQDQYPDRNLSATTPPKFGHDLSRIPVLGNVSGRIQAKRTQTSGDIYEQEAESVAQHVMHAPEPQLQRACACGGRCPKCQTEQPGQEHERLQTTRVGSGDLGQTVVPPIVHEVLAASGQPLDSATRDFMESRFGHDFSQVRVHTDAKGAESARAVDAQAYTVGHDVVFGAGQYAPGTTPGRRLLAHELTHVVQQAAPDGISHSHDAAHSLSDPVINPTPASHGSNRAVLQRMRRVREFRHLGQRETSIAQKVFKNTIPYDQVVVSDGLGGGDRPFTLPTSLPATLFFNVGEGKYVIHAGDGYFGMSRLEEDKKLLIHELTHVWQGEHSSHSWDYVLGSIWSQGLADDAYSYNKKNLKEWDDYNPEQQAQIVEDWFADGMKEGEEEDRRFYYIKKHIRGEQVDHDWIRAQWVVKPLPRATLDVEVKGPLPDPDLLPILEPRFNKNDVAGYAGRVKKLEEFFKKLRRVDGFWLLRRLEARRPGDKVAQYFHDHLSTAIRDRLTEILRKK